MLRNVVIFHNNIRIAEIHYFIYEYYVERCFLTFNYNVTLIKNLKNGDTLEIINVFLKKQQLYAYRYMN